MLPPQSSHPQQFYRTQGFFSLVLPIYLPGFCLSDCNVRNYELRDNCTQWPWSSIQGCSTLSSMLVNTRQDCRGKAQRPLKYLGSRRLILMTASKPPTNNLRILTVTQQYYVAFAPSHSFHLHFYDKEWISFNPRAAPQRTDRLIQMKWSNATTNI